MLLQDRGDERLVAVDREIPAGERNVRRPCRPTGGRKEIGELFECGFGKPAVGRDLAAEDRQKRRLPGRRVKAQHIVTGRFLRLRGAVVIERAHARIGPDDILASDRPCEIFACRAAEVNDLVLARRNRRRVPGIVEIGGADEGEVVLVGDCEDDAPVGILEDIAAVVIVELAHDDVRALDEAYPGRRIRPQKPGDLRDPRAGRIDDRLGRDHFAPPGARLRGQLPETVDAGCIDDARAGPDRGAPVGRIAGVEDDEARIVNPAVGIFEAALENRLQGGSRRIACQVEHPRGGQALSPADIVVEEKPKAQEPLRAQADMVGQHEAQGPHDVRREAPDHLALEQGLAHEAELVVLEIAQSAVDQLGRLGRRAAREIVTLEEDDRGAAAGRIARDTAPVDAAADDGEIESLGLGRRQAILPAALSPAAHLFAFLVVSTICESKNEDKEAKTKLREFRAPELPHPRTGQNGDPRIGDGKCASLGLRSSKSPGMTRWVAKR